MSGLVYRRIALGPQPLRELVRVGEAGDGETWRSNGAAVGRFLIPAPQAAHLRALAAATRGLVAPTPVILPADAPFEQVEEDGTRWNVVADVDIPGPVGALLEACRAALDELDAPIAAIVATLDTGLGLRLRHRGDVALPLLVSSITVDWTLWRENHEAWRATSRPGGDGRIEATRGWTLDVPVPAHTHAPGGSLVAEARFIAEDAGLYVPMVVGADVPT